MGRTVPRNLFFRIVRAGFSQPRKQFVNNLSNGLKLNKPSQILRNKTLVGKEKVKQWLLKNGVNPSQRAETLTIGDWIKLVKSYRYLEKLIFPKNLIK